MSETVGYFVLLLGIEAVLIGVAATRERPLWLQYLIGLNLMLVTLFSAVLITIFGYTTNITSVLYTTVLVCQIVMIERFSATTARETIHAVMFQMVAAITLVAATAAVPGPGTPWDVTLESLQQHPRRAMASLTAFWLSQMLLLVIYCAMRLRGWSFAFRASAAILVCQAADSVVFYPEVFLGKLPWDRLVTITAVGFMMKVLVGLALLPVVWMVLDRLGAVDRDPDCVGPNERL